MNVDYTVSHSTKIIERRKRKLKNTIFILLLYLFIFSDLIQVYLPAFGYFDELVALLAAPYFLGDVYHYGLKIKKGNCTLFVFLLVCVGFIGNVTYGLQAFLPAMLDAFLCIKFWLVIYVGYRLFRNYSISNNATRLYSHSCSDFIHSEISPNNC